MNYPNIALLIIFATVLILPFLIKRIEEELELFLFCMGCLAVTITSQWDIYLLQEAFLEPIKITLAVFFAGFLFKFLQKPIVHHINKIVDVMGMKLFTFVLIVSLGFLSSIITAIIASLVLVEIILCLKLPRKKEIQIVVLTCFSIGFGAALTPIGEPLSTIAIAKLKGDPYHADFFFLARQLGFYITAGIIGLGLIGSTLSFPKEKREHGLHKDKEENVKDILIRTIKVYVFIMALIFLGSGFKPLIDTFVLKIPYFGLYWINIISAILDNATLTAVEIGPNLSLLQIKAALLGLLIAGGMLIPGNIPNIIAAGKLKITSSEWAKFGVPFGLVVMALYFFLLQLLS